MFKKIIGILVIFSLMGIFGCSSSTNTTTDTTTAPASVKTVREANIASVWTMKQMEINTKSEITLTLKLAEGDKVDGIFYLESGSDVGFSVSGISQIYQSQPVGAKSETITSDRFSFTATKEQGIAYFLTFSANSDAKVTNAVKVFLELVYPDTGTLSVPFGTK